jgi:ribose transport system substrate-binding protein
MIFVLSLGALLTACGDAHQPATSSTGAAKKEPPLRVALIMKTLTNPFFVEMEQGARQAQKETGVDLQVMTATQETSIEQQIQLVEQQIEARVSAIVIAPGDSLRLVPVLKRAQDAGIPIVNIDNRLSAQAMLASGMKPVPFISVDNEKAAYVVASYVAAQAARPVDAAIIEGIRTADNAQQRKRGAERAFHDNGKVRLVASETANWKIDEAQQVAKALFARYPRIGLVFCANDMMAIGVASYLQQSGRTKVLVAGFDALDEAKTAIRAGQLTATIDQQARQQGYMGFMTALHLIRGETVPMEVQVESRLVTTQTLK